MDKADLPSTGEMQTAMLRVMAIFKTAIKIKDLENAVATKLNLTNEHLQVMHSLNRSEFSYRLAWERTHAKAKGLITKTNHATWIITPKGLEAISPKGL